MFKLLEGNNVDLLKLIPDKSVDSIVTDPPYGLSNHTQKDVLDCLTAWISGKEFVSNQKGFMNNTWDSWVPGPELWKECLRVLKPGGHILAFAGTRSMDLMSMAIRLGGFELRDAIGHAHDGGEAPLLAWCYGTGFPKNHDVAKAIDLAGGMSPCDQAALLKSKRESAGMSRETLAEAVGCTVSSIRDWEEGRARAVGRPLEFMVPSPAYRAKLAQILGYTADERLAIGSTTDRRGDDTVYGLGHSGQIRSGGHTAAAADWKGFGTALKPAWEPIILARRPLEGTVASNVLEHGTGALNIDASRVNGRHPANLVHDGSDAVLSAFPEKAGGGDKRGNPGGKRPGGFGNVGHEKGDAKPNARVYADEGSAARFFYCAKANKNDRAGSHHPTVKPVALMKYLVQLVTPPGGTVLDPFAGSGTTGQAALDLGFDVILIEREPEYIEDIKQRLVSYTQEK